MISLLVVDDDPSILSLITLQFKKQYVVNTASTAEEGFQLLQQENIDVVITDFHLPGINGLDFLLQIKQYNDNTECILISAQTDVAIAAKSIQAGAADYFKKPIDFQALRLSLLRVENIIRLRKKLHAARLGNELSKLKSDEEHGLAIIGNSPSVQVLRKQMLKFAQTADTPVMITGESGTGKELVAKGIHEMSNRSRYNFVAVNMSAIPEQLFESEFFGHRKGAFTGATQNKPGWFEIAQNGTLFLDEIGDMPLVQQVKLLRVIESKQFTPVGAQHPVDFDVRIISATNKPTADMAQGNAFRLDLYHRLATLELHLLPLRERKEDIVALVQFFADQFCQKHSRNLEVSEPFFLACENYSFPGNIRELRNSIERAVILAEENELSPNCLPFVKKKVPTIRNSSLPTLNLHQLETMAIMEAMDKAGQNKTKAAELLGIQWNALHRKLTKLKNS